ncbi:hypothetical protein BEWA_001930 [Theileria equi strain WA]|uniref:Uncharacterized protein n=1 Tax=Theileria equi strain WA TaxID=1537102 RepID=L0B0J7_THEEQ|nr:hypothetical protein BEWA_001930 [Theileria equi strain WA]AFZ80786.1 hypothetical protein BEWA_001930 [Theileria equi strain WA]|eukprot:XP_004830452.1 hypothetical protein BEWA_001930 [Theileria equi strain WA]
MAKNVDIKKKCPRENIINGTCQDNPQIGARKDIVSGAPDYEYCTHSFLTTWIKELKYNNQPLQIENGEILSNSHFYMAVVTTYYYSYGISGLLITTPLILGVKSTKGGTYEWYENTGDGIKWKTISNTAEFPSNDTGQVNSRFKDKLDRLACKLQGIVEIDLSKDKYWEASLSQS